MHPNKANSGITEVIQRADRTRQSPSGAGLYRGAEGHSTGSLPSAACPCCRRPGRARRELGSARRGRRAGGSAGWLMPLMPPAAVRCRPLSVVSGVTAHRPTWPLGASERSTGRAAGDGGRPAGVQGTVQKVSLEEQEWNIMWTTLLMLITGEYTDRS